MNKTKRCTPLSSEQISMVIASNSIQDFTTRLPLGVVEWYVGALTRISIVDINNKLVAAIPDTIHEFPEVFAIGIVDAVNELYGFKKQKDETKNTKIFELLLK